MRSICLWLLFILFPITSSAAKVMLFQEPGFPTVDNEPVSLATLRSALGPDAQVVNLAALQNVAALENVDLLVLPYGSAVPVSAWAGIKAYLDRGGHLLILGGQPLHVPVSGEEGHFRQEYPQDTFGRVLGFEHTAKVPAPGDAHFAWREGYSFLPRIAVHAKAYFAVGGHLNGLGYMVSLDGEKVAAPVIVSDHLDSRVGNRMLGARIVALDFDPEPGFWESKDGIAMIRAAGRYAEDGATEFWIETQFAAIRPDEIPELMLHLRHPEIAGRPPQPGEAKVELLTHDKVVESVTFAMPLAQSADVPIHFDRTLPAGFYVVRATYSNQGKPQEYYANGFVVEELSALRKGPTLGVHGDFLSLGGKPFLPVGTNYFTTEDDGWDFSGARNALVWERDLADMERHNVTFVRTGVWMPNTRFVEPSTGGVNVRFLRNVEAFLAAAQAHHIVVNFNFFSATPRHSEMQRRERADSQTPLPNPYLDPASVSMEQSYILSVVRHFIHVPWLCYDLINEPSFSNPQVVYRGNVPNGDSVEKRDWDDWLHGKYGNLEDLAEAWAVPPTVLGSFDHIPLPAREDMSWTRYGNPEEVRAVDYNLFAQAMFSQWASSMIGAIRSTGSQQLIDVGQDEGGVTDRVLNQFYATSGVSFTVNHTYWQDDALLWDSVVAKYPGMPNITGETGYQPVAAPDGAWRYDEFTGKGLEERKWALGFAAGSSGALQWDWAREIYFGIERSDGSAKVWEKMLRDLGGFAKEAEPYATGLELPQVAIVLPQSLQLSVYNSQALKAQQTAVRVLYNYDHTAAYAVGEYQINTLGNPRLIVLPSAYGLTDAAWRVLEEQVRAGATLLISGPFAAGAHLHPTDRAVRVGMGYKTVPLEERDQTLHWAGKPLPLVYSGTTTTVLARAQLPDDEEWREIQLGHGRILFSVFPLELNDRLSSVAAVYAYAMKTAGVKPTYLTTVDSPGILICPTVWPHATLYVLTSESGERFISFRDERSGRMIMGTLQPGRAALLLIGENGAIVASYNWRGVM